MASYTIKDLERLSGIKAHTIRIWEKRYNLIEPERSNTNIRCYSDAELKKLLNVSILNRAGIKISRIAELSGDEIVENINVFTEKPKDSESQIESLAIAMIDFDEAKFDKILSRVVIQFGFEETVIKIIYPLFVRIGIMWQTGSINPAHEHFISNLIRQKLIVAIDSQVGGLMENSKTFTLFLPEGELHELGLLFYSYLIKKRGHKVIYLGQTVPLPDLEEVIRVRPTDFLVTAIVASMTRSKALEYIRELEQKFSESKIYISGEFAGKLEGELPNGITLIKSPLQLINELNVISAL